MTESIRGMLPTTPTKYEHKPEPVIWIGSEYVICQYGEDRYMAGRPTERAIRPTTPPLTRKEITEIAKAAAVGHNEVLTWPHLAAVLAMGVILAYRDDPDLPAPEPQEAAVAAQS